MLEHFRGVIWPRKPENNLSKEGKQVYRYIVVGMLVTDKELDVNSNETCIDGSVFGMANTLESANRTEPPYILADANHVLLSLKDWNQKEK